jgi:hypothetical protein
MSQTVFLSTVDVAIRGDGAAPKTAKTTLSTPRLRFRPAKTLFDDSDAEINDREC